MSADKIFCNSVLIWFGENSSTLFSIETLVPITRMFKVQTEEALEKGIATNMKKSKKDKK